MLNFFPAAEVANRFLDAAAWVRGLTGWRRAMLAFLAGIGGALSLAPVYILPLLALSFPVLILLIDGAGKLPRPRRSAFAVGWWFGFGYFLAGIYWMAFSFLVQADQFAWMAPFAMTILPAGLALFAGAACLVSQIFWRSGWERIFLFAVIFAVFEYLRGHILTGLPWNLTGQALAGSAMGAQTAAWWGAYGLSLVTLVLASAPAAGLYTGASLRRVFAGFGVAVLGAAVLFAIGAVRLGGETIEPAPQAFVRIVQPNINQRDKINPDKWSDNFYRQLELSKGDAPDGASLYVIWPENGAPLLDEATGALDLLAQDLPKGSVLIAGAVRREYDDGPERAVRFYNSIAIIPDGEGTRKVERFYDKSHLVPFGEYLPFYGLLNAIGLAQLTPYGDAGFASGDGPSVIEGFGPAFAPLICYEAIFPGALYPRGERPRWLVTVTNDAWFGDTSGPRQHLDMARLRAIEAGLPMARAANTGISAVIDAKGRILSRVNLYEAGRIDAPIPPALAPTLYDRFGDIVFFGLAAAFLLAGFWRNLFSRV